MMENPESESAVDLTRPDAGDRGSDSRTESAEDLEERDDWMETEENDADDEEEEEEDEEDDDDGGEEAVQEFTPNVMIVWPAGHEALQMQEIQMEKIPLGVQNVHTHTPQHVHTHTPQHVHTHTPQHFHTHTPQHVHTHTPQHFHPPWIDRIDKPEDSVCVEVVFVCVCVAAAALVFPLLTWAGYKLLPFEAPPLHSSALRLVYTLRCAFFASFPIVLGVLAQGVSRLKFGSLKPLFDGAWQNREVRVHGLYVRDSLHLFLLYFLQLAVTATYAQQEMLKLVPLLTVIFVFGRLIYWACVALGSSVRALGSALSFLPLLVLLGANLYFIGSASGQEAVFDVAPPTTAPPPKLRWWG